MKRKYLFIEGAKETPNGNLREGFAKLFEQKLKGKMPTISMGEGKKNTIDKFRNSLNSLLLCDLDGAEIEKEKDLQNYELKENSERVFYMIQEMESWFISQPEILNKFYNDDLGSKLTKKNPTEFSEPDKYLQKLTKNTKKGEYHKVHHAVELLKLLNADKLGKDFPDFLRLINKLGG